MQGTDIERIKKYNAELRAYTEKSANIRAKLEFSRQETIRLCGELSKELGVEVTPANLEEVYKQCVEKINSTLNTGEEILNRIKSEERALESNVVEDNNIVGETESLVNNIPQMFNTGGGVISI